MVNSYLSAIEEIINSQYLINVFKNLITIGKLPDIMDNIIQQSKVEFNYF